MAFSKGKESSNGGGSFNRYVGVGSVKVLAVNPNMEEWNNITGGSMTKEPEYTGVTQDGVKTARITLLVQTDPAKTIGGIDAIIPVTFWFRKIPVVGSQSGKYMVIDAYNNTAWGTEEDIKAGNQIMYSNGPAKIIGKYRPAYVGEYELMNFIRQFLCIGSAGETNGYDYINGSWVEKKGDELKDCECSFTPEEIQQMFKGNFSCVKDAIALQPTNKVKVLFGIRTNEGKEYQDIYTSYVLRNSATSYSKLQEKIEESKAAGGLSDRIYDYFGDLREYKVVATDFTETPVNDPFAAPTATPWGQNQ